MLRIAAFVVIAASVLVILRALPTAQVLDLVQKKVATMGVWGPVVFGAAYFVAAVLFVSGSARTLAAGAIIGLLGRVRQRVGLVYGAAGDHPRRA